MIRKNQKRFKLPVRFRLGGHLVKVCLTKPTPKKDPAFGQYDETTQTIYIYPSARGSMRDETFCHELMHAIKGLLGHDRSERHVQSEGALLHQALSTMEYE